MFDIKLIRFLCLFAWQQIELETTLTVIDFLLHEKYPVADMGNNAPQ